MVAQTWLGVSNPTLVEHMGVSPSQVKSKRGNHFCPEESTSEHSHEFRNDLLSELSENKHQGAITLNESAAIAPGFFHSSTDEPSSEHVANNSSKEHLGMLPRGVSEHNYTNESIFHRETVSRKKNGCASGFVHKEASEKEYKSGSKIVQIKLEEAWGFVIGLPANNSQPSSENLTKNANSASLEDSSKYTKTDKVLCSQFGSAELTIGFGSGNICKELGEPPEQQQRVDSESLPNVIENSTTVVSTKFCNQDLQLSPEDLNRKKCGKHLQSPSEGVSNVFQTSTSSFADPSELTQEFASGNPSVQQPRLQCEEIAKNSLEKQDKAAKKLSKNSGLDRDGYTSKAIKKKYVLRSSTSSDRTLRSKPQGKSNAIEPSTNVADVVSSEQQRKRKRRKRKEKREVADEYSRIRSHLRYLLNRINYEQSLIAAYSAEGWKGLSLEKLKPEKELQRATSEILRRKLKIRDLFQRMDSLCAEGRLPENLFDSEGEIDSEDIFCAKCGSKDLPVNNDIILCDGVCDRGFHQYCLQPPLLKEDIPPGDEGWLCPGCDCKVDCIEVVNESQGTGFSLSDSWEKVFPEAAVAAAGQNQDPNSGLPSDDSDDNDYNPDASETDEKDQGAESSSDESDFTSTSEELEVPANVDPYLGLPSDDSEDDNYDPDGVDHDYVSKPESSSSDFSSDSEDLGAMIPDDISSQNAEGRIPNNVSRDSKRQNGKESLNDELMSINEPDSGLDGAVSKKRSIERLDYKKLYDETYGNVPSSSSDDEDWSDTAAPRRKKRAAEAAPAAANGNASARSASVPDGLMQNSAEAARRKTCQNPKVQDTDVTPAELQGPTCVSDSSGKKAGLSTYKRLGEDVKQRLYESFRENQYPDRAAKESLAKELDMTFQQVSKWFDNARWSFNNSPSNHETKAKKVSKTDVISALAKKSERSGSRKRDQSGEMNI